MPHAHSVPDLFGRATAVAADHAHLRSIWKRLRALVHSGRLAEKPRADEWQLLDEFAGELRVHFAAEEADGYFGVLVEERPELRALVERLQGEHREILELVAKVFAQGDLAMSVGELDSGVRELLDRFQSHERAEAQMLQEFFGRDDGGEGS